MADTIEPTEALLVKQALEATSARLKVAQGLEKTIIAQVDAEFRKLVERFDTSVGRLN